MKSTYKQSKVLNRHGLRAVFLSIAELNGYKTGTIKGKLHYGVQCWLSTKSHELDPINSESDRAEVHENIWLERLYDSLDKHFNILAQSIKTKALTERSALKYIFSKHKDATYQWNVPIELDATASMLQWNGVLLGDERLLLKTNVLVNNGVLNDAWSLEGIARTQFKWAATPRLYGSSRACHELWQAKKVKYTLEQVNLFNKEISAGALGVADAFKDFLINNCKPQATMTVKIFNEEFKIECNRYSNIGDLTTLYDIYDTQTQSIRRIAHTSIKKVPDLEQFRRFFVTLLIHNLDSQAANYVSNKAMDKYGWLIDIYDAFIVHPNMAKDIRKWYGEYLTLVYNNRTQILTDYFVSIGIGPEAQAKWNQVKSMVKPVTAFKPSAMALK